MWEEVLKQKLTKDDWMKRFRDPWNQWSKCWKLILEFLEKMTMDWVDTYGEKPFDMNTVEGWINQAEEIFRQCLLKPPGGAN